MDNYKKLMIFRLKINYKRRLYEMPFIIYIKIEPNKLENTLSLDYDKNNGFKTRVLMFYYFRNIGIFT